MAEKQLRKRFFRFQKEMSEPEKNQILIEKISGMMEETIEKIDRLEDDANDQYGWVIYYD